MLNSLQVETIRTLLNENRGKIFSVEFTKKDGSVRKMVARQGIKAGTAPLKGGEWANGTAGKAKDHDLILCSDMQKEQAGEYSRRSFKINSVRYIKIAGQELNF